ncbi:MAG: DUF4301 family protein [Deltaproteobacteria bacterium]|nr:DUF4301 family protein [Deltaproteobacteria bacterium]
MPKNLFSEEDKRIFKKKGLTEDEVLYQVNLFKREREALRLNRPCRIGDGIIVIPDSGRDHLTAIHDRASEEGIMIKFVPASGAASRMFRDWYGYYEAENFDRSGKGADIINDIRKYPFYNDLTDVISQDGSDIKELSNSGEYRAILEYVLTERGLNYAHLPKALIRFHRYAERCRTALEEHLVEAALYVRNGKGEAGIHLTISEEHIEGIRDFIKNVRKDYEEKYDVKFNLSLSTQHPSTDTIALDDENKPFRDAEGQLVFRPGGHGALLKNLNEIDSDIIFVKNIDNIVPDRMKDETVLYKKILGGCLLTLQRDIFGYLRILKDKGLDEKKLEEIVSFSKEKLSATFPCSFNTFSLEEKSDFLFNRLNRPLRVCGVVRNAGEPGGGPFWVEEADGKQSLQIVESAQVDLESETQRNIWESATHFNPVDLVCGVRDFRGQPFDLKQFVDKDTYLIVEKSMEGRSLRALERPGLWNGSMAGWNTVFVEVPIATFNPVKTVDDLLRKEHMP